MAYQKCVCGHVLGDPVPTSCRVLRKDGHFMVARTVYYTFGVTLSPQNAALLGRMVTLRYASQDPVLPAMGPWVQGLFGIYRADAHFMVVGPLYYPWHQLWVPWFKGYLVHITPLRLLWHIRNAHVAMFGLTLPPQTAASLGRMVILR